MERYHDHPNKESTSIRDQWEEEHHQDSLLGISNLAGDIHRVNYYPFLSQSCSPVQGNVTKMKH